MHAQLLKEQKVLKYQNKASAFVQKLVLSSLLTPDNPGLFLSTPTRSYLTEQEKEIEFADTQQIYSELITRSMNGDPLLHKTAADGVWTSMIAEETIMIEDIVYVTFVGGCCLIGCDCF